ncbi:uncharacterized protein H6S33_011573 [Morchella sextelata]|uniref:uncharacterized protein n=1 Tax=Morchella sextelata TaxID=1174677 RepID=UPI001D04A8D1|nr:uncharacterized protein H6S33_011573 [Morchella sextelata]KAH0611146.1 hypothetical protein H6S33_011573 [Morchella sextelata]
MPLIILSGYPCSGKTQRAHQIHAHFTTKITTSTDPRIQRLKAHTINTSTLHLPRTAYREARTEKEARATEYSAVKRLLSKDDVVIADGLNYIKGFRYQLFCEAKALLTPSCVVKVHVAAPPEKCREWNSARKAAAEAEKEGGGEGNGDGVPYEDDILENLIFRYEEPNGMSRWDSPLFTVPYIDETPDLDGIWDAMVGNAVKVKANQATVLKPASESDYLYELDKTTQDVVTLIQEHQKSIGAGGGSVPVADCAVALELPSSSITVPQLQRIRRQFIALNRQHGVGKERIKELFVEYVNAQFR